MKETCSSTLPIPFNLVRYCQSLSIGKMSSAPIPPLPTLSEWKRRRDSWARSWEIGSQRELFAWRDEWVRRLSPVVHLRELKVRQSIEEEFMLAITARTNYPAAFSQAVMADLLRVWESVSKGATNIHCIEQSDSCVQLTFGKLRNDNTYLTGRLVVEFQR